MCRRRPAKAVPELLNASHIIPWSKDIARRADPCNGIALYDRAFDRGLITFDESFSLMLSDRLKSREKNQEFPTLLQQAFLAMEGERLHLPRRFKPDPAVFRIINIIQNLEEELEEGYSFSISSISSNCSTCGTYSKFSIGSNCGTCSNNSEGKSRGLGLRWRGAIRVRSTTGQAGGQCSVKPTN